MTHTNHTSLTKTLVKITISVALVVALITGGIVIFRWASGLSVNSVPPPDARCVSSVSGQQAQITLEQSRNAAIIAGVAAARGLAPRAVSIALTTAFQESGIRNLDYGDRDSLGIFQQRPSQGWGTPEQIMDPFYSTGKFFDTMVRIKEWDTADIGDVAQAVQRSGFPDAYDKHVDRARTLSSALSGQTHAAWSCVFSEMGAPDPNTALSTLIQAYGATIRTQSTEATDTEPATITLTAASEDVAWSAAALAQSWASKVGVSKVRVGNDEWLASTSVLSGWIGVTDTSVDSTTVVVTF